jgi:hypothetical protein
MAPEEARRVVEAWAARASACAVVGAAAGDGGRA